MTHNPALFFKKKSSMKKLSLHLIFFALLALPWQVNAQWQFFAQPSRPYGQPVAADEQSFFISSINNTLLLSNDNGQSFQVITEGLPENSYLSLELLPEYTLGVIYQGEQMYRLLPDAQAWEPLGTPIPGHAFDEVHRIGGKFLASASENFGNPRIYQSTDEGNTWTLSESGLPGNYGLVSYSAYDSVAVATSGSHGAYFSTDGGDTWQPSTSGEDVNWIVKRYRNLIFAKDDVNNLIFSADGGMSWEPFDELGFVWDVIGMADSGGTLFTIVYPQDPANPVFYSSTDQGATWYPVTSLNINADEADDLIATTNGTLLVVAQQKLYASFDTGASWTAILEVPGLDQPRLVTAGTYTYLIGDGGLFVSADEGMSWEDLSGSLPMSGYNMYRILVDDMLILAASSPYIVRSSDGGLTTTKQKIPAVTHFLQTPEGIFASVASSNDGHFLYKSTDTGLSWAPVDFAPNTTGLFSLLAAGNKLFAGGRDQRVFVSEDGGESWSNSSTGIPFVASAGKTISLAYDSSTGKIYAAIRGGELYESEDMGLTWSLVGNFSCQTVIAHNNSIYVLAGGGGPNSQVYYSHDGGITWGSGTHPDMGINSLGPMALYQNNVLIGTNNGVFLSTNKGESWEPYNEGLPEERPLSFVQDEEYVYGGLGTFGIYRLPLNELPTSLKEPQRLSIQIFPNPSANGIFHLQTSQIASQSAHLEIADSNGRIHVNNPISGDWQTLDLSQLPAGIFWLRLTSKDGAEVQRLVKTR